MKRTHQRKYRRQLHRSLEAQASSPWRFLREREIQVPLTAFLCRKVVQGLQQAGNTFQDLSHKFIGSMSCNEFSMASPPKSLKGKHTMKTKLMTGEAEKSLLFETFKQIRLLLVYVFCLINYTVTKDWQLAVA